MRRFLFNLRKTKHRVSLFCANDHRLGGASTGLAATTGSSRLKAIRRRSGRESQEREGRLVQRPSPRLLLVLVDDGVMLWKHTKQFRFRARSRILPAFASVAFSQQAKSLRSAPCVNGPNCVASRIIAWGISFIMILPKWLRTSAPDCECLHGERRWLNFEPENDVGVRNRFPWRMLGGCSHEFESQVLIEFLRGIAGCIRVNPKRFSSLFAG